MGGNNLDSTVKAVENLLNSGEVDPYEFVVRLDHKTMEDIYGAIYAYNANKDAITSEDTLSDLYNEWGVSLDPTRGDIVGFDDE